MAKEITRVLTLQIPAGRATPAPPVGTALGPLGINLQEFCTKYNDATKDKAGEILPAKITVYDDRTIDFIIKTPPTPNLLKKYAKLQKGSVKGAHEVVATLTQDQIREIAEIKLPDLNAYDVESAMKIVEGTARNMGIAVEGVNDKEMAEEAKEALEVEKEMEERAQELAEMEAEQQASAQQEVPVINEENKEKEAE